MSIFSSWLVAVVAGHDVQRQVHEVDDLGVRLADAGGLDEDQVEARELVQLDRVLEHGRSREVLATSRERAHEDLLVGERVHADAVAEQRRRNGAGRIDRDDGDLPVREVTHETRQQLVAQARLARAARARDADDRCLMLDARQRAADLIGLRGGFALAVRTFEHGDRRRDSSMIANVQRPNS